MFIILSNLQAQERPKLLWYCGGSKWKWNTCICFRMIFPQRILKVDGERFIPKYAF
jgi:hypothetical protein